MADDSKINFNTVLTIGTPVLAIAATFFALQGKVETLTATVTGQGISIANIDKRQGDNSVRLTEISSDVKQLRSLLYEKRIIRQAPLAGLLVPKQSAILADLEVPVPPNGFGPAVAPATVVAGKPSINAHLFHLLGKE